MANSSAGAKRILVVRVGALGDTLMATPVLHALKSRDPGATVDFLCSETAAPLLELNEHATRIYSLRWRNLPLLLSTEKRRLVRQLRSRRYDLAVLLESASRYRRILEKAGIGEIRDFQVVPFDPGLHSIANNLRAAGFLGLDPSAFPMELRLSKHDRSLAQGLLRDLGRPRVGLHPGYGPSSRKRDQSNRLKGWGEGNFRGLGDLLLARGANLVLTGSRQDLPLAKAISRQWPVSRVANMAGRTDVRGLAAVIEQLDLLISVDSGPAHLAAALGTPLIVLWGPAKIQQVRPIGTRAPVEVIRHSVPCAPCYDTPAMKTCRLNICMRGISPGKVAHAAQQILSELAHKV